MTASRIALGDWRPVRDAIEHAYAEMGLPVPRDGIPDEHWNLAVLVLAHQRQASRKTCWDCRQPIPLGEEIRCLDCRAWLHEGCAHRHFWPNGRPKEDRHV